ncbi:MAG: ferritin family protein [bacterium]|nr:ferritin family protein [bacterium]
MRIEERDGAFVVADFSGTEAFRIACAIERDGARFYDALARAVTDPGVRSTLEFLAGQEREHLAFFGRELERERARAGDPFEEDDLLASLESGVFGPLREMRDPGAAVARPAEALRMALAVEERSILFYGCCRERLGKEPREALARIIDEERRHKALIEEMLARYA